MGNPVDDAIGALRKAPENDTPQELARAVVVEWLKGSNLGTDGLERLIIAAIRFEREQCARVVQSAGIDGCLTLADYVRDRTPGMDKKRAGPVIIRG